MNTGVKIALWVTGIAVVGVGAYFIIKSVKKANQKKEDEKKEAERQIKIKDAYKLDPNRTKNRYGADLDKLKELGVFVPNETQNLLARQRFDKGNPFTVVPSDLKIFQDWVLKKNNGILGLGGADGNWTKKTALAYVIYRTEFNGLNILQYTLPK